MTDKTVLAEAMRLADEHANDLREGTIPEWKKSRAALEAFLRSHLTPAESTCRDDGRCQYAIDHGAEGLGHCPKGKCCMPESAAPAEPPQPSHYGTIAERAEQGKAAGWWTAQPTADPLIPGMEGGNPYPFPVRASQLDKDT